MEATKFYKLGLVGHPVSQSLSQALHKAALEYTGLAGSYDLFDIASEELAPAVIRLKENGIVGFNITIPHKQAILSCLNHLSAEAKAIGAVNTVKIENNILTGYNTDVHGFISTAKKLIPLGQQSNVLILGSGGAARAAAYGLVQLGVEKIGICSRNAYQAERLASDLLSSKNAFQPQNSTQYDLLINATPIGLIDQAIPKQIHDLFDSIKPEGAFLDMVYSKTNQATALVAIANEKHLQAQDGTDMLVEQAALSFKIWTGQSVDTKVMKSAIRIVEKI